MNNPFRVILLLIFTSMTFFSCGEDEDPFQLVVSSNSFEFGADEETQILTITSN